MNMVNQTMDRTSGIRMPAVLLGAFLVIWSGLAIAPLHRADWLLENLIVFVAVPMLVWSYRRLPFSNGSYLAIFAFLVLHAIGSHYTYSEVPIERWGQAVLGFSLEAFLGIDRNHYDRVVHFAYGLLITPAAIELIDARSSPTPFWRWILVVSFITAHAALYELVEWAAAMFFAEDLRMAYLGTQGDVWDAQKDILLGSLGSAVTATALRRRASRRTTASPPIRLVQDSLAPVDPARLQPTPVPVRYEAAAHPLHRARRG